MLNSVVLNRNHLIDEISSKEYNQPFISQNEKSVSFEKCSFINSSPTTAMIVVESVNKESSLSISNCYFSKISSANRNICVDCNGYNFSCNGTCFSMCKSTNSFSIIKADSFSNSVNISSFVLCGTNEGEGFGSIFLAHGSVSCLRNNFTKINVGSGRNGIVFWDPETVFCSLCTIEDCKTGTVFDIRSGYSGVNIDLFNVVGNKATEKNPLISFREQSFLFSRWRVLENIGPHFIQQEDSEGGFLNLDNCFFDISAPILPHIKYMDKEFSVKSITTLKIVFVSNGLCQTQEVERSEVPVLVIVLCSIFGVFILVLCGVSIYKRIHNKNNETPNEK